LYKTIFDTWRSQVDSSWQRSNYFAAFETAAIGGCWLLVSSHRRLSIGAAIAFSVGGLLLTAIWYVSTVKTWYYVRHWWDSIATIEKTLALDPFNFVEKLEAKKEKPWSCVPYRYLVRAIPFIFGIVWLSLLILGIVRIACFCVVK
jgi:hypothetical protein